MIEAAARPQAHSGVDAAGATDTLPLVFAACARCCSKMRGVCAPVSREVSDVVCCKKNVCVMVSVMCGGVWCVQ